MRENTETKTKEDIGVNLNKCNQEQLSSLLILGEIDAGTYYHFSEKLAARNQSLAKRFLLKIKNFFTKNDKETEPAKI